MTQHQRTAAIVYAAIGAAVGIETFGFARRFPKTLGHPRYAVNVALDAFVGLMTAALWPAVLVARSWDRISERFEWPEPYCD